jgi:hypothetical protein
MANWLKRLNKWFDPAGITPMTAMTKDAERAAVRAAQIPQQRDITTQQGIANAGPIAGPAGQISAPGSLRPMARLNVQQGVNPFAAKAAQAGFTDFKTQMAPNLSGAPSAQGMQQMATALRGPSVGNPNSGGSYGR